jgi:hypothetical protein
MTLEREENDMAKDYQDGGRTFLAIVLGGIVLALVIAAYVMYVSRHESSVKVDRPAAMVPATPEAGPAMVPKPPAGETPAAPTAPPATNP